jgi:hypothetical protein
LAGRRDSADVLRFLGEMPNATAVEWQMELPEGLRPAIHRGVVVDSVSIGNNMRRWRLELGGNHRFQLRLLQDDTADRRPQPALLRESRTCEISPHGVEVSAQWKVQVYNEPLSRITVLLDPGLQLVSARSGDVLLSWTTETPPENEQATRVVLVLPEPIRDTEQIIRLDAMGQAVLDRPWKLPRIRAEGLFWQEGSLSILAPKPLVIDRITPLGCGQTGTGLLSTPRVGESMQFQAFEPNATVETLLSRRPANVKTRTHVENIVVPTMSEQPKTVSSPPANPTLVASAKRHAWVWDCELQSRYQADGAALHRAMYLLQNSGLGRIRLTLPPEVFRKNIRGVWIDETPIAWQWTESETAGLLTIELPTSHNEPRLVIEWTASEAPLGIVGSFKPPLPEPDLPVFARRWTVWLPPGYDLSAPPIASPTKPAETADDRGWSMASMELAADSPARLHYVHGATMYWIGLIAFLLTLGLGYWKAIHRPMPLAVLSLALFLIALLLPNAFQPPALGVAIGLFSCLIWEWIRNRKPRVVSQSPSAPVIAKPFGSTVSKTIPIGLIFLATITLLANGAARAESPIYQVWTPIDAEKKPIGDKVYVPETLYRELQRRAASTDGLHGWLISKALYRGVLATDSETNRLQIDMLRARYDLKVFGRYTQVRIPLRVKEANVAADGVRLDGRVIRVKSDTASGVLTFEVAEPGEYRLEIVMRPILYNGSAKVSSGLFDWRSLQTMAQQWVKPFRPIGPGTTVPNESDEPFSGIDLSIPRVAVAQFELMLPEKNAPSIDLPSASGKSRMEKTPSRLVADLGPADRLTVRWNNGLTPAKIAPLVNADQLVWLKIQPGSLVITARFHIRVTDGQIRQVQLAVDPGLRLLPLSGDDPPTVQLGQESGQSRLITFRWPHPITDHVTLETAFLLGGATGIGNSRAPRIELLDIKNVNHWMALSVVPTLDFEEQDKHGLKPVKVSDFLRAWKGEEGKGRAEGGGRRAEDDSQIQNLKSEINDQESTSNDQPATSNQQQSDSLMTPQSAYRTSSEPTDWTISTRSREPHTEADQTLSLSCDRDHLDMRFEALVSTTSGYLFQYRLSAPKNWKIEKVSLLEGNVERAGRWSRDDKDTVTIFLTSAVSGLQKILVQGSLPIPSDKVWSLPQVRLERCELRSSTIQLYQQPGVRWTFHGKPPKSNAEHSQEKSADRSLGRRIALFPEDESRLFSVTVALQPDRENSPSRPMTDSHNAKAMAKPSDPPKDLSEKNGLVRLADISMAWRADGVCYGTAAFDLEPGSAVECPLVLPEGFEWIHVSVEDAAVAAANVGDRTWRIPLSPHRKQQRVEVVFRGVLPEIGQSPQCQFPSPTLKSWPVGQTRWTVIGPSTWIDPPQDENNRASSDQVAASYFPATQPTMHGSFEGSVESWTLPCQMADSDRSISRRLLISGLATLALIGIVRVRRWGRSQRENPTKIIGGN